MDNCDCKFPIHDFKIVTIENMSSFTLSVTNVILFNSVTLEVSLFDANNNIVKVFSLTLSGDDYTNWGGDDTYLYQYVADKMEYKLLHAFDVSDFEPMLEPVLEHEQVTKSV